MKRILIQNGTIYDGLGGQPYQADLLVQDDRIAQIAPGITEPADQVIDCMGDVGSRIPVELRETALGGLAATPFGREVQQRMRASAAREEA